MSRLLLIIALATPFACSSPPEPPKEPVCSAEKPCEGGQVCRVNAEKPELNACVPCERDRECARDEFCHPLERLCRLRPCFGHECEIHDDCGLGQFCVQGLCLVGSETTAEGCRVASCADGEVCDASERCHPVRLVCEENLGCAADAECGDAQRCVAGRCELACTAETAVEICGVARVCDDGACVDCVRDADCGAGLTCNLEQRICETPFSCTNNRDCQAPLVCNRLTKECTTDPGPCVSEGDCPDEETCQLSTGKCVPRDCPSDRFEPNEAPDDAKLLPLGPTTGLSLCLNDVDYYDVPLVRGDRLQVVVDVDTLLNFDVAILGPVGELLAQSDFAVSTVANVDGNYLVRASSRDAYVRYGLRLAVSRGVPCDEDDSEPNDDYVTATPLERGDLFQRTICPANEDWYQVAVQPGQTVEVELVSSPLDGDLDLYLYDADRSLLDSSVTAAENELVTSAAFTGNRVFVKVAGATASVQNRYDLHVRVRQ